MTVITKPTKPRQGTDRPNSRFEQIAIVHAAGLFGMVAPNDWTSHHSRWTWPDGRAGRLRDNWAAVQHP